LEQNLLKQFKKYAHRQVVEKDTDWHWLSVAQHHGLPTRLIDWTYSPFIALHFATCELEHYNSDGVVWKVNYAKVHELLQDAQRTSLKALGAQIFSIDALASTINGLDALDALHSTTFDAAVFFEPPSLDERIVNQFAYFSALSDPLLSMSDWLARPSIASHVECKKIVIPRDKKWEIRDKLDQSNITERVLMPGLDGLCSWLKRHYKKRISLE
jgi:FRG domain